jgi:hypothetical protein
MGMGHIAPVINKVPHRHGTYSPCKNFIYYRGYMSHAHVEIYLLQGLYVPCPCGTLFITGVICPMPMWNFIYYRGYMSHAHVELYSWDIYAL